MWKTNQHKCSCTPDMCVCRIEVHWPSCCDNPVMEAILHFPIECSMCNPMTLIPTKKAVSNRAILFFLVNSNIAFIVSINKNGNLNYTSIFSEIAALCLSKGDWNRWMETMVSEPTMLGALGSSVRSKQPFLLIHWHLLSLLKSKEKNYSFRESIFIMTKCLEEKYQLLAIHS